MSGPEITRVALSLLRRDGGTQIRAQVSMDVAKEYAEAMGRGDKFPPVKARYDGTHYWVTDGFHRIMGAELIGQVAIDTEVRPGTRRDAILDAVGANAEHGYRRTNADKRQAVLTLLEDDEWSKKSDRELARIAHVDPGMVGRLRPPPSVAEPQTRMVSRGGKSFEMNVSSINRDRPATNREEPTARLDRGSPAADHAEPLPHRDEPAALETFDFAGAQRRDTVMQAIQSLADAPPPAELAAMWALHVGRGVPGEIVPRAAAWLTAFADLFPEAESARQRALTAMLEKL